MLCQIGRNGTDALTILDRIRDKRIVGNVPLPRTTVQEALRLTLDERRREFALQGGSLRLVDLKRLNREEPFKQDILHTRTGNTDILYRQMMNVMFYLCHRLLSLLIHLFLCIPDNRITGNDF